MVEFPKNESYQGEDKKAYRRVSAKAKQSLIRMVLSEGKKITSSARILRINLSTAKMIICRHRKRMVQKKEGSEDTENAKRSEILQGKMEDDIEDKEQKNKEGEDREQHASWMWVYIFLPQIPYQPLWK